MTISHTTVQATLISSRNVVWTEPFTVALDTNGNPPPVLDSPQDARGIIADGHWCLAEHSPQDTIYVGVDRVTPAEWWRSSNTTLHQASQPMPSLSRSNLGWKPGDPA